MNITARDITLDKFLKQFTPTAIVVAGKIQLDNALFMQIAAQLKTDQTLQKIRRAMK